MYLLSDIVEFLKSNGIVQDDGVDAFRDFVPDDPSNIVCLNEYSSPSSGIEVLSRHVQIFVRDKSNETARVKAWTIYKLVCPPRAEKRIINLTPDRWVITYPLSSPTKLKVDSHNRHCWTFNISLITHIDYMKGVAADD